MLTLDKKWGETSGSLLQKSMEIEDKRVQERLLALALVALGQSVRQVAEHFNRSRQTIGEWVHRFNQYGPDGLIPNFRGLRADLTFEMLRQPMEEPSRRAG